MDDAFHARFPLIIKIAPDDKAWKQTCEASRTSPLSQIEKDLATEVVRRRPICFAGDPRPKFPANTTVQGITRDTCDKIVWPIDCTTIRMRTEVTCKDGLASQARHRRRS
jgi:hypothetical protein